jgi:molybdopterin/thiamine biosynthesis adenylyltransferase
MILSKDQINRYLRHILIPEISGPGQKKILETKIFLYASNVAEASSLIYYLAASGVGCISCSFNDNDGFDKLYKNIIDLNCDVILELADNGCSIEYYNSICKEGFVIRILTCSYKVLKDSLRNLLDSVFIPTIIAVNDGWKGFLQVFRNQEELNNLSLSSFPFELDDIEDTNEGCILSSCLLSSLTAIESIKCCLNIGEILDHPLCFNLLTMQFLKLSNCDFASTISKLLKNNYTSKAMRINTEKEYNLKKLSESKVLIIGAGGLGSPVAYALASVGIGTIGFVDYDNVEISNLNRQILHSNSRIGMSKVESAKFFINSLNPNVKVVTHNTSLNVENAMNIIEDYDIIVDAVDNIQTRYLLNDSCFFTNKPLIDAAAIRFNGLIMTIIPKLGPCYRCAFPESEKSSSLMSCSEAGVLGPVPGVMGFMQAAEVIKLLLGRGDILCNRIIYYDALSSEFDTINMDKSIYCDLCGIHPTITC